MLKIIGLVDGSVYAKSVCDHIAWIAGRTEVSVDILHVIGRREVPFEATNFSGIIGLGARTALLEELAELDARNAKLAHQRGRHNLEIAAAQLAASGVKFVETKLRNGDLLDAVENVDKVADLIVIGKRGEGADFAKLHLGSNLERVVRSTRHPVLVASRAFKPINKVLVAFDGGTMAMNAVKEISRNSVMTGLAIKLLMAGAPGAEAIQKMEEAASILKAAGLTVETEIVAGQADKVISDCVETEGHDLLVMGAYSHSRLRSLFIGSTTTEMIRSCKIPVFLFRQEQQEQS